MADVLAVEQLGDTFALVAEDKDTDTASVEVARGHRTAAAEATGAEVDRVSCGFREIGGLRPMNSLREDLVAQCRCERAGDVPEVRTCNAD